MATRTIAWILSAAVAVYLVLAGLRAFALVRTGEPGLILFGVAVVILPAVGAWALYRELAFGRRTQELGRQLADEGGLPQDDLPRTPSGRVERSAADARFVEYQRVVESSPEDWRAWYRLAIGYDDARDRKRARAAMRESIRKHDLQRPSRHR